MKTFPVGILHSSIQTVAISNYFRPFPIVNNRDLPLLPSVSSCDRPGSRLAESDRVRLAFDMTAPQLW